MQVTAAASKGKTFAIDAICNWESLEFGLAAAHFKVDAVATDDMAKVWP